MSTSLLDFNTNQIKITPGEVTFNGFEDLKHRATQLAEEIKNVDVSEENIKVSKQMLAAVNKRVKEIEDKRISIKKEMLKPYEDFESQVKEITSVVKDADQFVRQQVKQLEEYEREEKAKEIEGIFQKRMEHYSFGDIFTFEQFIQPKHLNKSMSMNVVEKDMVEWLEKKKADYEVIQGLPNTHDVLMEYLDTKDLSVAMNNIKQHDEYKEKLEKAVPKKEGKQQFTITLSDAKDLKMVEMFMQENNINYEKVVE